ncbi:hypothetical protein A8C56_16805 [Niabella ginsenosidivorans]|uniref:Uncharacterized protein n=1 Tax=Niabella ginsenosidivorans TaxID=1176587 RepID=A0A1A9I454_9BACT|nr:hypothetical protein [Niabella ginsenosidivorans]ANH82406.1 hypothetical protein A8C56_16805 [Niabella ginsenosidivorans]
MYTLKIQKLLNQVEGLATPEEKIKLLLQAIKIADENEDIEWGYDLRLMLIEEERDVAFSRESIPAFAWVLKACDENPDLFSETDFLWQYKWMMSDLYDNPLVSIEQLQAALEDFKTRLQRNGYGLRAYYNELYSDALIQKDPVLIRAFAEQLKTVERDAMSDCQACEMDADVSATLELDGFEQGHAQAVPLLEKQYTCVHVPMRTLVNLSYHAYKNGQPDIARNFSDKAEEELAKLANDSSAIFSEVKLLICKVTGDPAGVKERLEQLIPKVVGSKSRKMFQMTLSLLEILPQFPQEVVFHLVLPEEHGLYTGKTGYTRNELIAHFSREAKEIARLFDERNGNRNFSKQVEQLL